MRTAHELLEAEKARYALDPIELLCLPHVMDSAQAVHDQLSVAKQQLTEYERQLAEATSDLGHCRRHAKPSDIDLLETLLEELYAAQEAMHEAIAGQEKGRREVKRRRLGLEAVERTNTQVSEARRREHAAGKAVAQEKAKLRALVKHFPELPMLYPHADLLDLNEMQEFVRPGLSFRSFADVEQLALGAARHEIFKCTLGDEGPCVLKKYSLLDNQDKRQFEKEAVTLGRLSHPNIIKLKFVIQPDDDLNAFIVLPYLAGGNLATWLQRLQPAAEKRRVTLHNIFRGVEYLHAHGARPQHTPHQCQSSPRRAHGLVEHTVCTQNTHQPVGTLQMSCIATSSWKMSS